MNRIIVIFIFVLFFILISSKKGTIKENFSNSSDIDIVYTYVDGSKEKHYKLRKEYEEQQNNTEASISKIRFSDHDELKYSLRSLEKYANWIRNIYIVVSDEDQVPSWLNADNTRINPVFHRDIFQFPSHLPTFNSQAIEANICNINGLSEYFIYSNDDLFFGTDTQSNDFFVNGKPIIDFETKWSKITSNNIYQPNNDLMNSWTNIYNLLDEMYNMPEYINYTLHQMVMCYKPTLQRISSEYRDSYMATSRSRFRNHDNIAPVGLSKYMDYYEGNAIHKEISNYYFNFTTNLMNNKLNIIAIQLNKPKLFCINTTMENEESGKQMKELLEELFPNKSMFEL